MADYKQFYNLSEAARLYGMSKGIISKDINRADGKGLTHDRTDGKVLIGIDELIRHYGTPEAYREKQKDKKQRTARNKAETKKIEQGEQNETAGAIAQEQDRAQLALIQAKLEHTEELLKKEQLERQRTEEQLKEQAKNLREQAEDWKNQAKAQTRLLTNEREKANLSLWQKVFGKK